jgi:2-oxoisovalerate dehydrogenase E1 component beta subunit
VTDATATPTGGTAPGHASVMNMVEAIRRAMFEEMARDPDVVLMGEDVGRKGGVFKASEGLYEAFGPLRVLDTPIAEATIAGAAIGAALAGLRPIAEFQFADYMHPAFDQIVNQAATMHWRSLGQFRAPVVFRAPIGAGVRGGIYHSQSVEAFYCHVPGLKVVVPSTARDALGLLKSSVRDDDPVLFFESKRLYRRGREDLSSAAEDELVPIGSARVARTGSDVSLLAYGVGALHCREAAPLLAGRGIEVEIVDLRTLAPFDRRAIEQSVRKTGRALVVHEANRTMGFGAEIAAFVAEELFMDLDAPVRRVASDDCHISYNAAEEDAVIPDANSVLAAVEALVRY